MTFALYNQKLKNPDIQITLISRMTLTNVLPMIVRMNMRWIFILLREWLLKQNVYIILLIVNFMLFVFGFVRIFLFSQFLRMALPDQLVFLILGTIFRKIYHRYPVDTLWSMNWKEMRDGIFNFINMNVLIAILLCVI